MKFLAILKDSLRETLDVKLFYFLVGLSVLTVILVGSITYKPVPVQRYLEFTTELVGTVTSARMHEQGFDVRFHIENFKRLDSRTEPWLGDYQFEYVVTIQPLGGPRPGMTEAEQKTRTEVVASSIRTISKAIKEDFERLFSQVEVSEGVMSKDEQGGAEEVKFTVVTKNGTRVKNRQDWYHEPALFFGTVPIPVPLFTLGGIVTFIADWIIGGFGAMFTIMLSIIITASFLPGMLGKGTVDMLVVKPIHRWTLLMYKFLGGLLFMFLNTVIIMVGLWLAIGLQAGTWLNSLLLCIFVFTFQFAIFYAVSAVTAVLTRSTIVCILAAFLMFGLLTVLGWAHWIFIENKRDNASPETRRHWAFVGFDALYYITPRYKDLDWLTTKMISKELIEIRADAPANEGGSESSVQAREKVVKEVEQKQVDDLNRKYKAYSWTTSLIVTSVFILAMLGIACWRFTVTDY
jgi:ABC-type transport system involved in multi-copper enzyme maturation permease subunit